MKKTTRKLPGNKRGELDKLVRYLRYKVPQAEMIILFGSYGRGEGFVDDIYVENGMTYSYQSDFDILILVSTRAIAHRVESWGQRDFMEKKLALSTPVNIISHEIKFVNKKLKRADYFFSDIKKEGVMLYDSGNFQLERIGRLKNKERANYAQKNLKIYYERADDFYFQFENGFRTERYSNAAFQLHQATESFFTAIMLVFKNYKPKTHDLLKLNGLACNYDHRFIPAMCYENKSEQECFDLLNRAYIEARYKEDFKVTKKQLEFLAKRIKKLQSLTNKICKEKNQSFIDGSLRSQ